MLPKLTSVCAPPGYGKTVLLSMLYRRSRELGERAVWISLDDRDSDLQAMLALLAQALAQVEDHAAEPELAAQEAPGDRDAQADQLLARLTALAALPAITVVFLDNLHFCSDEQAAPFFDRLLFASPPSLRLVVSSVDALPIDMLRAKLELGARALDAGHLAFGPAGIASMFLASGQPILDHDLLDRIHARTEGWPAAVRLLLILSAGEHGIEGAIERFSGEDSDIALVLTRRVLADFDPQLVRFLQEIALLREFSAELASHVTGAVQAPAWITTLVDRNLLVFPLDRSRRWLRMHTLLREYLLAEGRTRIDRERRQAILQRAAQWHADQGDDVTAIDLAIEAPSMELAARWIDRVSRTVVGDNGQLPLFVRWVEQVMASGAPVSLDTHTWYIWALCFSLQYEAAQRSMEALDARLAAGGLPPGEEAALRKRLGMLRVVTSVYLDNLDVVRKEAGAWLADGGDPDAFSVAVVATGAAVSEIARLDFTAARLYLDRAGGAIARTRSEYGIGWVAAMSACIALAQGGPEEADRLIAHARPTVVAGIGDDSGVVATMDFVHAKALLDLGRIDEAQVAASRGLRRAAQHGVIETAAHGLACCLALWGGEPDSPWAPSALETAVLSHPPRLARLFAGMYARKLVRLGRVDEALDVARRGRWLDEDAREPADGEVEASAVALARIELALAQGHSREGMAQLERRLKLAKERSLRREQAELHLMAMAMAVRHGEVRLALRQLTMAIVVSAPRKLVWPFHEHLEAISRVLADSRPKDFGLTQAADLAFLARLQVLSREHGAPLAELASSSTAGEVERLTPRELALIELLSQGLSNQQLADREGLSVPTVKWHLYNLYAKLNVKSRAAAVAKARSLGALRR
jgi:LuxR family maltose regulon positive regulatory protein